MTSAQKIAKEKFKKAIEYRNKTGVSLKEAFAHVYGRKVSGTGNTYIFKVYDRNDFGEPINNTGRKVTISASSQSNAKDKLYKKYPSSKYFCELMDSYTNKVGAVKKAPAKKVSIPGKHTDTKSHNVNIKIVSGIGNIENATYKILGLKIGFKKEIDKETGLYIIQVLDLSNNKKIIPISNNSDSKEVAYDITEYIKYYTNTPSNVESYGVRRKLEKLVPSIKKEVQKLNKSVKKAPVKKVAVKKAPAKKVARQSRSSKKVKATYKVDYQTGTENRTDRGNNQDAKRKALPPGKRISKSGRTYYETRANRTDFSRSAMTGIDDYKNLSLGAKKLYKEINQKGFFKFNSEENILIFLYDEAIKKGQFKKAEYLKELYDIL